MYNGYTKSDYVFARLVLVYYLTGTPCSFANTVEFNVSSLRPALVVILFDVTFYFFSSERDEGVRVATEYLAAA